MDTFHLVGVILALLSLIWSEYPFMNLVYAVVIIRVLDWNQFNIVTGAFLIALFIAHIVKAFK